MCEDLEFSRVGTDESAKPTALVSLADPLVDASQLAKPTGPVGLASPVANPTSLPEKLSNWPNRTSSDVGADLYDWRTPLLA
jgi:hypothetical protein